MKKMKLKSELKVINEQKPPGFAESLVDIFSIIGTKTDFSNQQQVKQRLFKDDKGVFREMDEEKNREKTIVAE
ncbi:hypothetical protein A2627_01440 [Candidatus Woesebacteria bacterium RIFCSPHIGHO2_01_FULL_39_28]|uniref:Uncharacterized protein n=1 Tax=Candidatus Woesebacteria bacterium RIFCSPHIGHO2_01_FULL_39_28 TaxID=1802496 RepID=A0A1F7YIF5_9BACT|nr:MAG: hypothetical protein A2627_01440 [Candidatus Woesebacteria bacterium RIFCSPHIGHO2_01_FULL_39_28]OGM57632.1 MAG: hypothetical protein A3A50_01330 [Candidatus Woesebacteria bacterium RIFCSPLOWO2_01_FULL_38_20]